MSEGEELTPKEVGGFRILRRLASGATSDVLLARAEGPHGFQRVVALKILLSQRAGNGEAERKFASEASAYARLSNPAVVKLYDFFSADGQLVMVLEYVDGLPLHKLRAMLAMSGERIEDKAAMYLGLRLFSALAAAHGARDPATGAFAPVIHADVNPSNILVPWDGQVKLGDFGIARAAGLEPDPRAGFIKGTYGYMAPEQVGGGEPTARSDVYSAGLIVWELLARRKAVQRGSLNDAQVLKAIEHPEFPSLDLLRPELDSGVRGAIGRALEAVAEKRTITAEEMVSSLQKAVQVDEGRTILATSLTRAKAAQSPADPLAATAPLASMTARELAELSKEDSEKLDPEQTAPFEAITDEGDLGKIAFHGRLKLPADSVPPLEPPGGPLSAPAPSAPGPNPPVPPRPVATAPPAPRPRLASTPALDATAPLPPTRPKLVSTPTLDTSAPVVPRPRVEAPAPPRPKVQPVAPAPAESSAASLAPTVPPVDVAPPPPRAGTSNSLSKATLVGLPPSPGPGPEAPVEHKKLSDRPTVPAPSLQSSPPPGDIVIPPAAGAPPPPGPVPSPEPPPAAPVVEKVTDPFAPTPSAAILSAPPAAEPSAPALPPRTERSPEPTEDGSTLTKPQGEKLPTQAVRPDQPPYVQSSLPPRAKRPWAALAMVALLLAGGAVYVFLPGEDSRAQSQPSPTTPAAPPTPSVAAAPAASAEPLPAAEPTATASVAPAAAEPPVAVAAAVTGSSTPPAAVSEQPAPASPVPSASSPAAPPAVTAASASPTPQGASDMGDLVPPASAAQHRIFVDGKVAGEGTATIHLHCGSHLVKVGSAGAERKVDVPCGGALNL